MENKRDLIRQKLEEELRELHFSLQEEVVDRAFPKSMRSRVKALWNKELRLPVLPAGIAAVSIVAVIAASAYASHSPSSADADLLAGKNGNTRQLIDAAGSTYWRLDYEKAVATLARNR